MFFGSYPELHRVDAGVGSEDCEVRVFENEARTVVFLLDDFAEGAFSVLFPEFFARAEFFLDDFWDEGCCDYLAVGVGERGSCFESVVAEDGDVLYVWFCRKFSESVDVAVDDVGQLGGSCVCRVFVVVW